MELNIKLIWCSRGNILLYTKMNLIFIIERLIEPSRQHVVTFHASCVDGAIQVPTMNGCVVLVLINSIY